MGASGVAGAGGAAAAVTPPASQHNTLGETIRRLRKRAGLTQEELAEGVCSPVSVSRIECGRQMPSKAVLDALLARLGASTYQLCNVYYEDERQRGLSAAVSRAKALVREKRFDEARALLAGVRDSDATPVERQEVLFVEALLTLEGEGDAARGAALIERALRQTKPDLDLGDFRHALLSPTEANAIEVLAACLHESGQRHESIRMGEELMRALDAQESPAVEYQVIRINLAINISGSLDDEGRYEESLEYASRAEELSHAGLSQVLLPEALCFKARALARLGRRDEALAIFRAVLPYMELAGKGEAAQMARSFADELGLAL